MHKSGRALLVDEVQHTAPSKQSELVMVAVDCPDRGAIETGGLQRALSRILAPVPNL